MSRHNGDGIEIDVAWIVLAAVVLCFLLHGCNAADLTRGATPSSSPTPNGSGWTTPTPEPFKTVTVIGPTLSLGCTGAGGNADYSKPFVGDPDDPPTMGDALVCLWMCAIDPPAGITTPSELIEVWDFDAPAVPTEYAPSSPHSSIVIPGYPQVLACNSWHP